MAIDKSKLKHLGADGTVMDNNSTGLISIIDIDGKLYELHDKCVDEVVAELEKVESRVTTAEADIDALESKVGDIDVSDLKDAVDEVEGKVDHFLGDTYDSTTGKTLADVEKSITDLEKKATVSDTAVSGKYVTHVTQTAEGGITTVKADLNAAAVAATKGETATTVQAWLEAIETTLNGDTDIVGKVTKIITELEEATNGGTSDTWNTLVDKLRGLPTNKSVKDYVDDTKTDLVGTATDTADKDTIKGAKKYADDAVTTAKSALVGTDTDASTADTIKGAKKYTDEKTKAVEDKLTELAGAAVKSVNKTIKPDATGDVTITANDLTIGGTGESSTTNLVKYLEDQEKTTAQSLNDLNQRKLDKSELETASVKAATVSVEAGKLKIVHTTSTVAALKTTTGNQGA